MPTQRETGLWILGAAGLGMAVALGVWLFPTPPAGPAGGVAADGDGLASAAAMAPATRATVAVGRLSRIEQLLAIDPEAEAEPSAPQETKAAAMIDALNGLADDFSQLGQVDRARATELTGQLLDRFRLEPAPGNWGQILPPAAELLTAALADPVAAVRASALAEVGRVWTWQPGRTMPEAEKTFLGRWKERLHAPLVKSLDDAEPGVRMATVQALGALPIDSLAAPALSRLRDENPAVRMQVLNSFAGRRDLLSEEDVVPRLFDTEPAVTMAANVVLRARGLNDEQIGLAKLLYHPKPAMRVSAIALLADRTDIDPVVWLVQLSYDPEESVRTQAMEALADRESTTARNRVVEMARSDPSEQVRTAARQKLPEGTEMDPDITNLLPPPTRPGDEAQAADPEILAKLPPLPGLPAMTPRAN
ncbi:hypothetical protein BH23PLA1_BH23PLA1_33840 [soil metagenome]